GIEGRDRIVERQVAKGMEVFLLLPERMAVADGRRAETSLEGSVGGVGTGRGIVGMMMIASRVEVS
ncbi:hypothetical protein SERLA73DRAFT_140338, partial [Serpula lacrymans var. lacrymans S7.3]